jgi:hypothetical protein
MGPFENQLQRLRERHPEASWEERAPHGLLVTIPRFELPPGWNKSSTQVKFFAPQGYPYARPDCFWADGDLRLQGRSDMPQNSQINPVLPELGGLVWFSWHLAQWDPNRDDLLSWVGCIRDRMLRVV